VSEQFETSTISNMWLLTIELVVLILTRNFYRYIYIPCCVKFRKQRKVVFGE